MLSFEVIHFLFYLVLNILFPISIFFPVPPLPLLSVVVTPRLGGTASKWQLNSRSRSLLSALSHCCSQTFSLLQEKEEVLVVPSSVMRFQGQSEPSRNLRVAEGQANLRVAPWIQLALLTRTEASCGQRDSWCHLASGHWVEQSFSSILKVLFQKALICSPWFLVDVSFIISSSGTHGLSNQSK